MRDGDVPIEGAARRRGPVRLRLGFASDAFGYTIEFGLPPQDKSTRASTAFSNDPEIKRECIFTGALPRAAAMLVERINGFVRARDKQHEWHHLRSIDEDQSMLGELGDPPCCGMADPEPVPGSEPDGFCPAPPQPECGVTMTCMDDPPRTPWDGYCDGMFFRCAIEWWSGPCEQCHKACKKQGVWPERECHPRGK